MIGREKTPTNETIILLLCAFKLEFTYSNPNEIFKVRYLRSVFPASTPLVWFSGLWTYASCALVCHSVHCTTTQSLADVNYSFTVINCQYCNCFEGSPSTCTTSVSYYWYMWSSTTSLLDTQDKDDVIEECLLLCRMPEHTFMHVFVWTQVSF